MRKAYVVLSILMLIGVWLPADEGHHHTITDEQVGSVSFQTSCNASVQKQFARGVAWLYSFEYEQADREFQAIAKADPQCAIAYWGQAMSIFHQLWSRPNKEEVARGADLLKKGLELKPATQRERDYLEALALFYASDDPEQYMKRVAAYSDAMDRVRTSYPEDREAAVFYALSLLAQTDGTDPSLTKERKAVEVLNEQLKHVPNHPGIMHYIIHATDNPQLASMGLEAARAYAKIAPASAHAVHMPSHIFARLGLWQDDIKSNLAAIAVADSMEGLHSAHHRLHSMDFLLSAYLQIGDDAGARKQIEDLAKLPPKDAMISSYDDYYRWAQVLFPATYALERRQWKDAMAITAKPEAPPYVQVYANWSRAIAAGHLGDAEAARAATAPIPGFIEATKKSAMAYLVKDMETARDEALAWQHYAEGNQEEAEKLLRAVADNQDKVGKGETDLPAREMLADMMLMAGRAADALKEYEVSLQTDPNRFNGLYGAARAAEQVGSKEKAAKYYAQIVQNCSGAASDRPELEIARKAAAP